MLLQRSLAAAIGVPVILGLIVLGGVAFVVAVAAVLAVATLEFSSLVLSPNPETSVRPAERTPSLAVLFFQGPLAYLVAALVALLVAAAYNGTDWWTGTLVLAAFLSLLCLVILGQTHSALGQWLAIMAAVIYVGFLGSHIVLLRDFPDGRDWVMLAVFGAFITDTSAYFVGKAIGRRKLAPRTSPGKTWEGTVGGLALGGLGLVLLNWLLGLRLSPGEITGLALLLPLTAVVGDLAESLLKRGAGIKDASVLVPGHGGFLDRLDSLLFCVPLVYYYGLWVVR